uniref:WD40 repeat n=1 Tax=Candidatus Kentrum sp. FM TaxID=2126340 RepID=A0A450STA0_9GAMM|nr:MAG: WD40 repeat [Candidatus Kentron sp. FM]VFJ58684.1 MAG: WD40 repeat [Candidatus Kentron sp. FM]VFK11876.1 MAG: WD40 repeat [Candidatus Kentron sp. FM]
MQGNPGLRIASASNFRGHSDMILSVDCSPIREEFASTSRDHTVRIWSAETSGLPGTMVELTEHSNQVAAVRWSGDGKTLAFASSDDTVKLWDAATGGENQTLRGHIGPVLSVAWAPDDSLLASASVDCTVRIWSPGNGKARVVLEGHSSAVRDVAFSQDGQLLASCSFDDTVRLWRTDDWSEVVALAVESSEFNNWLSLAFSPEPPTMLATLGDNHRAIYLWELDPGVLLGEGRPRTQVHYTSAKVVLVGESEVGKSCLAMRMAEGRYPKDHEHGTTHGMRFWNMEAEDLHPSARASAGQRRDVVLWDFGGQDEYRLVHQLFLHDTTLALVLMDPTRGRAAFDQARDWNRRLQKQLGEQQAVKLLVGAKQDQPSELVDRQGIEALCAECGFAGYVETSAKAPVGIGELKAAVGEGLDWNAMTKTSRPELFQRIRDEVELRREAGDVVVLLMDLAAGIREGRSLTQVPQKAAARRIWEIWRRKAEENGRSQDRPRTAPPPPFDEAALATVTDQLATQGVIVKTRMTSGEQALVLQLPVVERYAGALIIAARNHPRRAPVLEERLLGSPQVPLPGLDPDERLERLQERVVLECVVELMITHGLCFRHGGLLVFPSLFPAPVSGDEGKLPHSVSLYYDFTGAIDNIYAALVARLMVGGEFGQGRLWPGRVEFDRPSQGVCGIHQLKRAGGLARVDLFFAEETPPERRDLFTRFVEEHLRENGVEIREHQAIRCRECQREITEDMVQANIAAGEKDVVCPWCRTHTLITEGVERIRARNPESEARMVALRKRIGQRLAEDVKSAKRAVAGQVERVSAPIRVLHLSDLHFEQDSSPKASLRWLLQDLRNDKDPNFPAIEKVEYLVLSGDVTHQGDAAGFDKARAFVERLIEKLGLSALRCIFVPGNHDIQQRDSCYRYQSSVAGLDARRLVKQGDIYLVRDDTDYPNRLKPFSDAFYHKVTASQDYPLAPENQGLAYFFEDTGIQFIALNTAWEIDQFHPRRSGVHPEALANALTAADKQVREAVKERRVEEGGARLRIAVFHHAVSGPWAMEGLAFLENLQTAGVRLCLHGDVHEMRRQWIDYWDEERSLRVLGAGTFGAKRDAITEGSARSYNLIEITPDLKSARVYVREQPKSDGAWRGWNRFPDPDGGRGEVPFFHVELDPRKLDPRK